jgi:hypothetical protein
LYDGYQVGIPEWVFAGASKGTIDTYNSFYTLSQTIFILTACFFILFENGKVKVKVKVLISCKKIKLFKFINILILAFLIYKAIELTQLLLEFGYMHMVDNKTTSIIGIVASSFAKPLAVSLLLLHFSSHNVSAIRMFWFYIILIALSWQRKDLVSLLLLYVGLIYLKNQNYKYILYGFVSILVISMAIFGFREGVFLIDQTILTDIIWATGISINSGLHVMEYINNFKATDSLGFIATYFYCGLGRIIVDTCYTNDRLNSVGFLLEKISSQLFFESETVFGGLGGNVIGAVYVAAFGGGISEWFSFALYIFLFTLVSIYILQLSKFDKISVVGCLFIINAMTSSRYAFDALIPPANQLIVALFIDKIIFKYNTIKITN